MELYTVPTELVQFVQSQFRRFNLVAPQWRAIEEASKHTILYVAKNQFFPSTPDEAGTRYNTPGLTHPEKVALIGPVEFATKGQFHVETLHLCVWSALMWCWSEEGIRYVSWYERTHLETSSPGGRDTRGSLGQLAVV